MYTFVIYELNFPFKSYNFTDEIKAIAPWPVPLKIPVIYNLLTKNTNESGVRVGDENWQGFGVFRSSRLTDAVSPENPLGHDPLFHRVPSLNLPQPSLTIMQSQAEDDFSLGHDN